MSKRDVYTVECLILGNLDGELSAFLAEVGAHLSDTYGKQFDWRNFRLRRYVSIDGGRITVCRRDGKPVGLMAARLYDSVFDPEIRILMQDTLYARPGTRAAKVLLDDFIDFGKSNANHVITMIGEKTNIKRRSLERLGFSKLEELYRIEV